jgi:translation elongation factor EF-G
MPQPRRVKAPPNVNNNADNHSNVNSENNNVPAPEPIVKDVAKENNPEPKPSANNAASSADEVFVGFSRIFSGTIRKHQTIWVLPGRHNPAVVGFEDFDSVSPFPHAVKSQVEQLYLLMGNFQFIN